MAERDETEKNELINRIVVGLDAAPADFARLLYRGPAYSDLKNFTSEALRDAALRLWEFSQVRPAATPLIQLASLGNRRDRLVLEIINDDMPFLVDSVSAALDKTGLGLELLIHPIIEVARDSEGNRIITNENADKSHPPAAPQLESVMQIYLSGLLEPDEQEKLIARLRQILCDVRYAVADWRLMAERMRGIAQSADPVLRAATKASSEQIAEANAFLEWLLADNFTFLGYREYLFEREGDHPVMNVIEKSGLGVLRDASVAVFDSGRNFAGMTAEVRAFLEQPDLVMIAKSTQSATVHRAVPMDVISCKAIDETGRVVREQRFLGLFTSNVYQQSPLHIPLLRQKIRAVLARAKLDPASHDGKSLLQILDSYPRDDLFAMSAEELFEMSMGILRLQERRRVALFVRNDPFERFVSCLVYVPQERYDVGLRDRFDKILAAAFKGEIAASYVEIGQAPLARLHLIIRNVFGRLPTVDIPALENQLIEAGRTWGERLQTVIGDEAGDTVRLIKRYANAFPASYCERYTAAEAIGDIARLERGARNAPGLHFYASGHGTASVLNLKLYRIGQPVTLSEILPILEHHGFLVLSEIPYKIKPLHLSETAWIQDLELAAMDAAVIDVERVRDRFQASLLAVWRGQAEDDGFARLCLSAGLDWREVAVLRGYAKYLRQAGFTLSQNYIEETLAKHHGLAAALIRLFHAQFVPEDDHSRCEHLIEEIKLALDAVTVLDEDRIIRRYLNLIRATLRTNFYQSDASGEPKSYISFKLDSKAVMELPRPLPLREIWVYSPDVEAIHLRGGLVARGGIRFSDRREDFRTEILGLMKAQTVKNAVIVPVGSKGGFVVKRYPAGAEARSSREAHVIHCYKTMMRGLLDITDNRVAGNIETPPRVVRRDVDDPYLVVAADKGTASFSDIANGISAEYNFWLGDAFASGGSVGYDHKAMGITARGAWISVERHWREAGLNPETEPLTVIGVGDMSGDVFGNGMLLSDRLILLGAFNHLHIFIDPTPDPAKSFAERKRLFELPRSSWADYDPALISPGGGVFDRQAKTIQLSAEMTALCGLTGETTPAELIQSLLKAEVDLLWFGGIGTYVKAVGESHFAAGDRANDSVRVNASQLRATIIGEGANLAVTQRGRIEYAANSGRINTDAIDNSAGVDTSDHEVNLKILFSDPLATGDINLDERNRLLTLMTPDISGLVLRDNYLQNLRLSTAAQRGADLIGPTIRLMHTLERDTSLDRDLEALPTDQDLFARGNAGLGVFRPELAVLMGFAKINLYAELLGSTLPEDPYFIADLTHYFPAMLQRRFATSIARHGLRREIISTVLTNEFINRCGITILNELAQEMGCSGAEIINGFIVARELLLLPKLWEAIEMLDHSGAPEAQLAYYDQVATATVDFIRWYNRRAAQLAATGSGGLETMIRALKPAIAELKAQSSVTHLDITDAITALQNIVARLDVIDLAERAQVAIGIAAEAYSVAGARFGIEYMRELVAAAPHKDDWSRAALQGLRNDFSEHQKVLAQMLLRNGRNADAWKNQPSLNSTRLDRLLSDLKAQGSSDVARLSVAERQLRELIDATERNRSVN